MIKVRIFYMILLVSLGGLGLAQTNSASQKALALRANVVHIKAEQDVGFGFITGEKEGKLYVVTAAHVLADGSDMNESIQVQFFQVQGSFPGKVVFEDQVKDLAVVEVAKPNGLTWQKNVRGKAAIGDFVAFIGRDGDWYVPLANSVGNINRMEVNTLQADITSVVPGTSGAPLVTASGIVGMILDHSGYNSRVLDLQEIKRVLRRQAWPFQLTFENYELVGDIWYDEDGNTYPTKLMADGKRWLTQNLDLEVDNSWCYDNNPANCEKYGRMYTWEVANAVCPLLGDGWGLPDLEEWRSLSITYGGEKKAYRALMEAGNSGFDAQLGGWRTHGTNGGSSGGLFTHGYYWSATSNNEGYAYGYVFDDDKRILGWFNNARGLRAYVRCLQD